VGHDVHRFLYVHPLVQGCRRNANPELLDDAVELNIWTNAEVTITIMAASIPVLRAFLKEKVSNSRTERSQFTGESSFRFRTPRGGTDNSQQTTNTFDRVTTGSDQFVEKDSQEIEREAHGLEFSPHARTTRVNGSMV
jgi:hypothetical protein